MRGTFGSRGLTGNLVLLEELPGTFGLRKSLG